MLPLDKQHMFVFFFQSSEFARLHYIYHQGDYVACEEDGIRPYALLFCLSWFQKKEKKPDPPPQVYDVDLMKAEQEEDPLDIPVLTRHGSSLIVRRITDAVFQSQPEAGRSRLAENKEYPEVQSV
ncbi:hypothetical protein AZE42_07101 [Rhizopogon vesiculosus]|uniref:Uncharacterized protein n=1 Tax=Rhizopogon vesiculosus TaxID=180088 RepID=A0A1J8QC82_9AGAM|nr:hypothetical protein AZE42_07101 [Rhizopogon vesiculosus]